MKCSPNLRFNYPDLRMRRCLCAMKTNLLTLLYLPIQREKRHQTESDPSFGYPAGACELQSWAGDTDPSGSPISFE